MPTLERAVRRAKWLGVAFVGLAILLTASTAIAVFDPGTAPVVAHDRLSLAISTFGMLAAAAIAALAWGRHREAGEAGSLYRSSAFVVLAVYNGFVLEVQLANADARFGMLVEDPGQLPLWATLVARLLAGLLLVVAGLATMGPWRGGRLPDWSVLLVPSLLGLAGLVGGLTVADRLPVLVDPDLLARLGTDPQVSFLDLGAAPLLVVGNKLIALAFAAAAWLAYRAYRGSGRTSSAVLALGLVVGAFAQLHAAVHPDAYGALVTSSDLLRLLFYGLLLASVIVQSREDVRELQVAHAALKRLREAEVAQAAQEERARLAREIHDGLAQDLWYAKLKQGRLASMDGLTDEARGLAGEVTDALDTALADARQAVLALRPSEGSTFGEVLQRYVEDFSDRFGIGAECLVEWEPEGLSPRAQAELLRIVQEALNNVRKHADATLVRVEAGRGDGAYSVAVVDNGRGFDPAGPWSGYGLRSMQERAGIVGARLEVDSRPHDGTRVVVTLPVGSGGS